MSTKITKLGNNDTNSICINEEKRPITLEKWKLEEKRFQERLRYHERMQYHCTIIGSRGFEIKCRKDCTKCPFFWSKIPNKVSIEKVAEFGFDFASEDETPIQYAERIEKEDKVYSAIDSLPSDDLKVVVHMFIDGYSFNEIGNALGISKQAAFKKWNKAKDILKEKLQDYWDSINS